MVCGEDVLHAIRNAYPEGIVSDDVLGAEDSYFESMRDDVRRALRGIQGTVLLFERPPEGRLHWSEGSDPKNDPPDWVEDPASYDLVFLGLEGAQFEFEGELEEDEAPEGATEPRTILVPSAGRIGCAVGISIVAPFAVARFTEMEWTDTGSNTLPDIEPSLYELDGSEADMEAHYEELYLEAGIQALRNLRREVAAILLQFGIRVLAEDELKQPIPELQHDPERHVFDAGTRITVEDALFFRGI